MSTFLTYTIDSGNAVPTPGTTDFCFTIGVENKGGGPVILQYFQIAIPIGDGENDLTPTDDTASIAYKVTTGWDASPSVSAAGDYYNVTFGYTGKGGLLISPGDNAIAFSIDNITVNSCLGTAECMVIESTESPKPPPSPPSPPVVNQGDFSFTKSYPPTPNFSFSTDNYVVPAGSEVTVSWSGPTGWIYTITCGDTVLPQPTANVGSYIQILQYPTTFTAQATQTGQPPLGPIQFTIRVTPSIVFTGVGQTNNGVNQLVLAWSTLYASQLTGSWTTESLHLSNDGYIAPHNDWTSSQYYLTATSDDPNDKNTQQETCLVIPPVVNSFAPGSLQQDETGRYYMVLAWNVSGAFYVKGSWVVDDTVQFNPIDQSLNIYAPFAAGYTITAYVLDVCATGTIQTANYFAVPIIEQFNGTVDANTLALNWNVQPGNQNSPPLSVHGSWQSGSLSATGSQTLNCPYASSYTLTALGLVSGQSTQQEITIPWRVVETVPINHLPSLSCIAPDNTNCLVGFNGIEDNSGNITALYGVYIISNGKIASQINIDVNSEQCTAMLATSDGKTVLFVIDVSIIGVSKVLSYDINTAQPINCFQPVVGNLIALTPDNSYLYAIDIQYLERFNLASGELDVVNMPSYSWDKVTCMSITPNGEYLFIGVGVNASGIGHLIPVSVQSNTLLSSIVLANKNPCSIAFTPDNQYALVVSDNDNTVLVIDLSSLSVTATLTVDANPQSIVITPDGRYAFVGNTGSDTVSVIDADAFTVVKNIPVCSGSKSLVVAPDSSCVVVSNNTSNVSVIGVETLSIVQTLHIYATSSLILPPPAFAPDGSSLYIVSGLSGELGKYAVLVLNRFS